MSDDSQYDAMKYFGNLRPPSDDQPERQQSGSSSRRRDREDDKRIISKSNYALVPLPRGYGGNARDSDEYEDIGNWSMIGNAPGTHMINPGMALVAGIMGAPKSKLQLAALVVAVLGCGAMMSGIAGLGLVVLLLAAGLLTGGALVVILVCCAMIAAVVTGVPVGYVAWKVVKDRWLDADG